MTLHTLEGRNGDIKREPGHGGGGAIAIRSGEIGGAGQFGIGIGSGVGFGHNGLGACHHVNFRAGGFDAGRECRPSS